MKEEQKEQAEVGQEDTKEDVTAENRTKRRVHPVAKQKQKKPSLMMNILFQLLSVVSILPLLFNCLVKACFLDTLKIITNFLIYLDKCKCFSLKGKIRYCCLFFCTTWNSRNIELRKSLTSCAPTYHSIGWG